MFNLWIILPLWLILTVGIRMLFERHFLRRLLGLSLIGYVVNLGLLFSGVSGVHQKSLGLSSFLNQHYGYDEMSDPLPQALILTAIVIGFALTGFLLIYELCIKKEAEE